VEMYWDSSAMKFGLFFLELKTNNTKYGHLKLLVVRVVLGRQTSTWLPLALKLCKI